MHHDSNLSFILIPKCEYCGRFNVIAHKRYTNMCEDCGKRYHKYSSYKSQQRTNPTTKRDILLADLVEEYKALKARGYKVPKDIK